MYDELIKLWSEDAHVVVGVLCTLIVGSFWAHYRAVWKHKEDLEVEREKNDHDLELRLLDAAREGDPRRLRAVADAITLLRESRKPGSGTPPRGEVDHAKNGPVPTPPPVALGDWVDPSGADDVGGGGGREFRGDASDAGHGRREK